MRLSENFVALFTITIRSPSAIGSSVPACPTLFDFIIHLSLFIALNEEIPLLLFNRTIPSLLNIAFSFISHPLSYSINRYRHICLTTL